MCLGCTASSAFWDAAGEDQQSESPEELKREKLALLRERLEGRPVRLEGGEPALGKWTIGPPASVK
jgi:hypothetical protein